MKVSTARIVGLAIGFLFGSVIPIQFLIAVVGAIGVVEILVKGKFLKGQIGGFLVGLSAGYFLRVFLRL